MRISLWQQFSSNHSARFTVAGVFQTPEAAHSAAAELNQMIRTIAEWYQQPENAEALANLEDAGEVPPSPPEIAFSQQYAVEWNEMGLDWCWPDNGYRDRSVTSVDRLVFVDGGDTWNGAKPIDAIIQRLGGKALVSGSLDWGENSDSREIIVDVTCTAPDKTVASSITRDVQAYIQRPNLYNSEDTFNTPWRDYGSERMSELSAVYGGSMRQNDLRLHFEKLDISGIGYGLPALLTYLQAKGCTEIEYTLTETETS